ncbi:MAG TPA: gliding motility lipoprotein GldH [Draconibacterium sp.]|nr:gliding motility lipoprotein GldH [Draconibacterium sp.]
MRSAKKQKIGVFFQVLFLAGMFAILGACDSNVVFEQYQPISNRIWNKDSVLVFDIPVTDTISNHNLYLSVRSDVKYSYSNLWLFITIKQPDGKSLSDKFEITLADPGGKWLGEGFGGLKTREVIFRSNVFFPVSGEYKISIGQGMREDVLQGISDIGIRIDKAN